MASELKAAEVTAEPGSAVAGSEFADSADQEPTLLKTFYPHLFYFEQNLMMDIEQMMNLHQIGACSINLGLIL